MTTPAENPRCPQCGAELPPNAPQGLCPRCLLAGVDAPTDAGDPSVASAPKPESLGIEEISAAFPQLEIVELIGRGGMGFVYKARQPRLDRYVALKVLPQRLANEPGFRERFTREGRMLARLNHPNIVSVFDFGESGGFFYLLMEYVDGVNLRQAMRAGRFTLAQALKVVPEICGALSYAHGEGVLHRDIKPENILLDTKGRVKIADFGIAKLVGEAESHLTATDARLGTPHYMAPEQIERPSEVDHRADIYSLGVVFYEMLTGELPLGHFKPPSERSPLDPRVDEVVMRALARERERRQQSAGEVKTQVEGLGTEAPPPTAAAEAAPTGEWHVRCLTCGKSAPLSAIGGLRIGAVSLGKRILVRCSQCRKLRWARVEDANASGGTAAVPEPFAKVRTPWKFTGLSTGWSFTAIASGLLALVTWAIALIAIPFVLSDLLRARALAHWAPVFIPLAISLIPAWIASWLGSRAFKDAALRDGSKRGARLAAFGRAALPSTLVLIAVLLAAAILRPFAPFFGFLALPALAAAAFWFAAREHREETGKSMAPLLRRLGWTLGIVYALLMVTAGPAMCSHRHRPPPLKRVESVAPSTRQLSQGSIELVGVAPHPSIGKSWWTGDGRPATEGPFLNQGSHVTAQSDQRAYEFVFRTRDLPAGASLPAWQFEPAASWAGGGPPALMSDADADLRGYHLLSAALPEKARKVKIKAGIAAGAWQTIATSESRGSHSTSRSKEGVNWSISFGEPLETKDGEVVVNVAHPRHADWQMRVVAVNAAGEQVTPDRTSNFGEQIAARFTNLPLTETQEFRFQARRYEWAEFRNIALRPASSSSTH